MQDVREVSQHRKGPKIASAYNQVIKDYEEKGYVTKVPKKKENQWFLPYFTIVREDRTTTNVRIVFAAADRRRITVPLFTLTKG